MNRKRKILVFIDWFLPGYKAGGPVRSCANLVEHLKEEYEFYILTRNTEYGESTAYNEVKSDQWTKFSENVWVQYISQTRRTIKNINAVVKELDFDVAYVNGIYSPLFSILPAYLLRRGKKPVVIATRGMLAETAISIKGWKKKLFLNLAKWMGLYKNVTFHATNEDERIDIVRQLGDKTKVEIAPNLPRMYRGLQWRQKEKQVDHVKLVNVARIAPEKNLKFAVELLKGLGGSVELDLYGPVYSEVYWERCGKVIADLPENVRVTYKGALDSKKIRETLEGYHFMLMPTKGENFGHIILESMISGCPVIISDKTPWKNLEEKRAGWDLGLNQEKAFFEVLTKAVKMDQKEYDEWSESSFKYAKAVVNDTAAIQKNKELFDL